MTNFFEKEHLSFVQDAFWPLPLENSGRGMNSGVMVITPQPNLSRKIMSAFPSLLVRKNGKPIGDQDILQEYFHAWKNNLNLHLPLGYNFFFTNIHKSNKNLLKMDATNNGLFVVHFVGKKPWKERSLFAILKRIGYRSFSRAYVALYFEKIYYIINNKYKL